MAVFAAKLWDGKEFGRRVASVTRFVESVWVCRMICAFEEFPN